QVLVRDLGERNRRYFQLVALDEPQEQVEGAFEHRQRKLVHALSTADPAGCVRDGALVPTRPPLRPRGPRAGARLPWRRARRAASSVRTARKSTTAPRR